MDSDMMLKPQDVVILLKLVTIEKENWSFSSLSTALYMSPSETHAGIHRTIAAKLAVKMTDRIKPVIRNLEEFLLHGLRYVFVPDRGEITRGMPTLHAGPPLSQMLVSSGDPLLYGRTLKERSGDSLSPHCISQYPKQPGRIISCMNF